MSRTERFNSHRNSPKDKKREAGLFFGVASAGALSFVDGELSNPISKRSRRSFVLRVLAYAAIGGFMGVAIADQVGDAETSLQDQKELSPKL